MTKLNKRLAMVLSGLVVLYILAIAFHTAGRESNVEARTIHIDTSGATEVDLYPYHAGRQEIKLVRQAGKWRARSGSVEAAPTAGTVESLLASLANIPARRLVSRRKDKWDEYKVGDTTGTRVVVYKGKDPVGDYFIGNGGSTGPTSYGGGASYIRENGHAEVFAVEGYLSGIVDKSFADWRDRSFLRLTAADISGISFQGAPGFVLSKRDSSWWLGAGRVPTDSVNRYLSGMQSYNLDRFSDDFSPSGSPDRSILFSGVSTPVASVKAWKRPDGSWVVNSSQNPDGYFSVSDSVMARDLWRNPVVWAR
jgi:hypothetical protein